MNLKVLLLFLFSNFLFCSAGSAQVLLEQLHKKNSRQGISSNNILGDVKMVRYQAFLLGEVQLKFRLSMLNYTQTYSSESQHHYDKEGNLIKKENSYLHSNRSGAYQSSFEYGINYIRETHVSSLDSIEQIVETKFNTTYNDNNQLVNFDVEYPSNGRGLEEIEYFSEGKKCSVYYFTDSTKIKGQEFIYDIDDNLLSSKFKYNDNRYVIHENHYRADGNLDFIISRPYLYSVNSIFDINLADVEGVISGTYTRHFYNSKGILKKKKVYKLAGENIDGEVKYWMGRLEDTYRYKEKRRKGYIFQKTRRKPVDGVAKTTHRIILDEFRNKIAEYRVGKRGADLYLWDITYY